MVNTPTSIETLTTPDTGVLFYKALEHLDPFTAGLMDDYPRIVVETEAVKGLVESQPFFHEEYKDHEDTEIIDLYIQNRKSGEGSERNERLHQEMAWRHRLREESFRATDAGDAIKKGIFDAPPSRKFTQSDAEIDPSNRFMSSLIEMCDEQLHEIGNNRYGKITLPTISYGEKTFFARFDGEVTVFGSKVSILQDLFEYVHEASADDCCQLVADLRGAAASEGIL